MTVSQNKLTFLLVSRERTLRNEMNYLFSVVLKLGFEAVEGSIAAREYLAENRSLDVVLVHLSGPCSQRIELIEIAKSAKQAPVVIVLHSGDPEFRVLAFFAGADDVVIWPCSLHELAVRLFVRLGRPFNHSALSAGDTSWDTEAHIADRAGLTTAEAEVMRILYKRDGEIVSRDDLSLAVDARPWCYGDRKFDVHVAKIRKKLLGSFGTKVSVSTIRSRGYSLVTEGSNIFDSV